VLQTALNRTGSAGEDPSMLESTVERLRAEVRTANSMADNIRCKPGALEAGRRALEEHFKRTGERAHVAVDWRTHAYWVRRDLEVVQKISIITTKRDSTLSQKTSYPNFELVIVDLASQPNLSAAYNVAVKQTNSPWILFLDRAVEPIESEWLTLISRARADFSLGN